MAQGLPATIRKAASISGRDRLGSDAGLNEQLEASLKFGNDSRRPGVRGAVRAGVRAVMGNLLLECLTPLVITMRHPSHEATKRFGVFTATRIALALGQTWWLNLA